MQRDNRFRTSILGGAMMAYGAMNPAAGAAMGGMSGAGSGLSSILSGMGRQATPSTWVPPTVMTPMYYGAY